MGEVLETTMRVLDLPEFQAWVAAIKAEIDAVKAENARLRRLAAKQPTAAVGDYELPADYIPQPTPQAVVDAIFVVSKHLETTGYADALITPGGGTSFHRAPNTLERIGGLLDEIVRLRQLLSDGFDYAQHDHTCPYRNGNRTTIADCDCGLPAWKAAIRALDTEGGI